MINANQLASGGIANDVASANNGALSQKAMQLWTITQSGTIQPQFRTNDISLTGNYVGYANDSFIILNDKVRSSTGWMSHEQLNINVRDSITESLWDSGGTLYDDGNNKVIYKADHRIGVVYNSTDDTYIYCLLVSFRVRLIAGTFFFGPNGDYAANFNMLPLITPFYYQIANTSSITIPGAGAGENGDGKYYYRDSTIYNVDNSVYHELISETIEFQNGDWARYPYVHEHSLVIA